MLLEELAAATCSPAARSRSALRSSPSSSSEHAFHSGTGVGGLAHAAAGENAAAADAAEGDQARVGEHADDIGENAAPNCDRNAAADGDGADDCDLDGAGEGAGEGDGVRRKPAIPGVLILGLTTGSSPARIR